MVSQPGSVTVGFDTELRDIKTKNGLYFDLLVNVKNFRFDLWLYSRK